MYIKLLLWQKVLLAFGAIKKHITTCKQVVHTCVDWPNIGKLSQDGKEEYLSYHYHLSAKCLVTVQILEALIPFSLTAFRNLLSYRKINVFSQICSSPQEKKKLKSEAFKSTVSLSKMAILKSTSPKWQTYVQTRTKSKKDPKRENVSRA